MARPQFSKAAESDLEAIAEYTFLNFGEAQAREYQALLDLAARTAANFPRLGRPYTTKAGRVYQRYNAGRHSIFYRSTESGIFIVRVLHQMMDIDRHLD